MPPRQAAYLLDILLSAKAIQRYTVGYTHEQFLEDSKTQDAVLRRFLVAGEPAARLSQETRNLFPQIPFHKIAGMRNRVVHDYGQIDLDIVWESIEHQVPILLAELQQVIADPSEPG